MAQGSRGVPWVSSSRLRQLARNRLRAKYELVLCFYEVKPINQIMNMNPRCEKYMEYCDLKVLSQDIEYMKRLYYYRTLTGKPEIEQRMRMICEHYATHPSLSTFTYEYPMMVVTNTKSLFLKRKRRLRKIQAGQGSSDDTESQQQQQFQFEPHTQYFLDELSNSSLEEKMSSEEDQMSYEEDAYDIYSEDSVENVFSYSAGVKINLNDENVTHLIEDYGARSTERPSSHFDGELPPVSVNKNAFANIENQPRTAKESTISVTPIQDKKGIERKEKQKTSLIGNFIDYVLERPVNFAGLGVNLDHFNGEYKNLPLRSEHPSLEKQKEERASRRQKIREKAQELLKRVRSGPQGLG